MRRSKSILVIAILLTLAGCAHNLPPELVPTATMVDAAHKVNELMNVAISLEANGTISTQTARLIVKFCVATDQTLQMQPANWKSLIKSEWESLKANDLIKSSNIYVNAAFAVVDTLIEGW